MKKYFDSEDGPSKSTSHPSFVKGMSSDFYYDCTDEFSPFGNDDGADLLFNLEDWYRSTKLSRNIVKWMFNQIDEMGFEYQTKQCAEVLDLQSLKEIQKVDEYLITSMDNSIIATGFGQIKVTGEISPKLKLLTIKALDREVALSEDSEIEYLNRLKKMKEDLLNYN